jgi:hypothetical protein
MVPLCKYLFNGRPCSEECWTFRCRETSQFAILTKHFQGFGCHTEHSIAFNTHKNAGGMYHHFQVKKVRLTNMASVQRDAFEHGALRLSSFTLS